MMSYNKEDNVKNEKIECKTGGKLYIAGEYSILTPGQSAIIKNINIYMKSNISRSEKYEIYSDMFDYEVDLEYDEKYFLIQETVYCLNEYFKIKNIKIFPFRLEILGKMEKEGKKYGIGSSGSVVILVIKSMSKLYDYNMSKEELFKLASYVLLKRGDNGSMGDIACISYENLILYKSFDRVRIREEIKNSSMNIEKIMNMNWGYEIEEISCSKRYDFLVGWTKKVAISKNMINEVKSSINEKFLTTTEITVNELKENLKNKNTVKIKENIEKISGLLNELHSSIYSEELRKIVMSTKNINACSKSSGAGGGDCGIAISFDEESTEKIKKYWEKEKIELLYSEKI